ncbi:acyltransferase [Halopseudomonas pelagia]|uniref:Acyltransferase n=1 Tax=Halopseudomonas pelagia TaxID=553151 RepID=A0AA91Z5S4_9GAMM|nr:acyltransferase [Halopseudomonas pelagia]PCC98850.1 acyltransferase [Halopseudomonas pelagia]QFY58320.1 acyltransferase [Halopseudomonas pelagia]
MPPWLTGTLTCLMILLFTLIGIGPMLIFALIKVLIPLPVWRRASSKAVMWVAESWAESVKWAFNRMTPTIWDIRCDVPLNPQHSYLVVSNHQSWVDIPALLQAFNRKTPYFKFFLKKELIWIPFLGLAFWALDYPFMKRYSKAHLARFPEDQGKDLEITRQACEKFQDLPVTVVNFIEGTRYTDTKHRQQRSPFANLLKPKSGGIAFVMAALGEQMKSLLDVSILYPEGKPPGFWALLCGRVERVIVDIRGMELSSNIFEGDYSNDPHFRAHVQDWVNQLWLDKDRRLTALRAEIHLQDNAANASARG